MWSRFILRLFPPRNAEHAAKIKSRFSILYGLIGWHSFVLLYYIVYKHHGQDDIIDFTQKNLKEGETLRIIKLKGFSGFEQTELYKFPESDEEELKNNNIDDTRKTQ